MAELTYWPKRAFFYLMAFTFRIVLASVFWGKKRTVPPIRNQLLLKSATQLAKEIRERKLKSEKVVQAYIDRILEVEPYINAVVQNNFDGAIEEARKIDALIESGKFSIEHLAEEKPLLGVPFTVKGILKVKGFQDTACSVIYKDRTAESEAPPVTLLRKAGGIFLALTNSPEFGCSFETVNKMNGKTSNPYDLTRTCGGSSGGEAALISAAGSVIGLGNDFIGSVRIPSHFCCLFAHKPSTNLVSTEGNFLDFPPLLKQFYSVGPMCRYSQDLFPMINIIVKNKEDINFRKEVDFKNINIYYLTNIEHAWVFNTDRDIVQAVQNAASHFKKKYGTSVKEVEIPLLNKTNAILLNSYNGRIPNIIERVTNGRISNLNGIIELIKILFGKCRFTFSVIVGSCFGKWPLFFNKSLISQCDTLNKALEKEFDVLLDENSLLFCPTWPKTAPYHQEIFVHIPSSCFTSTFSMLGLPVTQCPMGLDKHGLPMGIQVVGRRGNDVLTLLTASELEKAFGGWTPP